jgi:hypothetical protein
VAGYGDAVVTGDTREFLAATAGAAGALTGLLFVALSVAPRQRNASLPAVILQVRAAAAMLAFSNALAVSLFTLVPGTGAGYPATVLGVIGVLFTAAAIRSIVSSHATTRDQVQQVGLIALLVLIFGTELVAGIAAIATPGSALAVEVIGYTLVSSLLVGIGRAWELVSERNTGVLSSLAVLAGRVPGTEGTAAPGTAPDPAGGGTEGDGAPRAGT